jgi:hypothetical protein
MTRFFKQRLTRFATSETGSMVVPFALWAPVFIGLILSSIELGTVTIRQTALERAMDDTVREIRLGRLSDHAAIKQSICDGAAVLPGCEAHLHLEMLPLSMTAWNAPAQKADCVDVSENVTPNRNFRNGEANEMMLLRACYKYQPITPAGTLSSSLAKDADGYTALVVTSAYVNEPS